MQQMYSLEAIHNINKELFGNEYEIIKVYTRDSREGRRIILKHKKCNKKRDIQLYGFIGGKQCACLSGRPRFTQEQFKERFYKFNKESEWNLGKEVQPYIYPNGTKHRQFLLTHIPCGFCRIVNQCYISRRVGCPVCNLDKEKEK